MSRVLATCFQTYAPTFLELIIWSSVYLLFIVQQLQLETIAITSLQTRLSKGRQRGMAFHMQTKVFFFGRIGFHTHLAQWNNSHFFLVISHDEVVVKLPSVGGYQRYRSKPSLHQTHDLNIFLVLLTPTRSLRFSSS